MPVLNILAALLLALSVAIPADAQFRRDREFRSLNTTAYEISVLRNGRMDVALANRMPVFENVFPMAEIVGERRPTLLKVDGRYSQRYAVQDALGEGQGMILATGDCEWSIRTYPTQPFFAIQASFVNTTKNPVRVAKLTPFAIGEPREGGLWLGPGTTSAVILSNPLSANPQLVQESAESAHHLAIVVPATNRSLILGFLTRDRAETRFVLERTPKADEDRFDLFRAECIYDPPVEVPPGGRLESEVLYVGLAESNPVIALERLARATAVANGMRPSEAPPLHGFYLAGPRNREAGALAAIDAIAERFAPLGFRNLTLGPEWSIAPGDGTPDPERYPNGLRPVTEAAARRGIEVGVHGSPFQVARGAALATDHPEWLLNPPGSDTHLLDPRVPAALNHIRRQYNTLLQNEGVRYFVGGDISLYDTLPPNPNQTATRVALLKELGWTVAEGIAPNGRFVPGSPHPWNAYQIVAHGAFNSDFINPETPFGEALARLAPRLYQTPALLPGPMAVAQLTGDAQRPRAQRIATLTALTFAQAAIQLADDPATLSETDRDLLQRLTPPLPRAATPADLFLNRPARAWTVPLVGDTGPGMLLAVFNPNETMTDTITIPLERIQLDPNEFYTLYDSWENRYLGTARRELRVEIPPGEVQVLGLRPFRERPMFLASGTHLAQGAAAWDSNALTLSGLHNTGGLESFEVAALVPDGYTLLEPAESVTRDGRIVTARFDADPASPTRWTLRFARSDQR